MLNITTPFLDLTLPAFLDFICHSIKKAESNLSGFRWLPALWQEAKAQRAAQLQRVEQRQAALELKVEG